MNDERPVWELAAYIWYAGSHFSATGLEDLIKDACLKYAAGVNHNALLAETLTRERNFWLQAQSTQLKRAEAAEARLSACVEENRVLRERALRFRDMAEMVSNAFRRDDHAAMVLFGNNVVAHIAREALLADTHEPKP